MSNGRVRLILKLPEKPAEKLDEAVEREEALAEKKIPGELKWVDKKLVASELKEISKRFQQIKSERGELERDIEELSRIDVPKKPIEVHFARKRINKNLNDARKIDMGIVSVQAIGSLVASIASGAGLLIAGAAGIFGILGGILSGMSLQRRVDSELMQVQRGIQVLDKMDQLKDELGNFERERIALIQKRGELLKLFGEEVFLADEIPIKVHISRVRKILRNMEIIKEANRKFLRTLKPRETRKLKISEGRLRELHDSALERTYVNSSEGVASRELFIKNIAKELAVEISLRREGVSSTKELSHYGASYVDRISRNFEKMLVNLEFLSSDEAFVFLQ